MFGRVGRIGAGALLAGWCLAASPLSAQMMYYAAPSAGVAGTVAPVLVAPPPPVVAAPVVAAPAVAPVVAVPVMMMPVVSSGPVVRSYYRVKKGGRLLTVAKKNGVTFADLVRLNPGLDAERPLPAGTMVALPIP